MDYYGSLEIANTFINHNVVNTTRINNSFTKTMTLKLTSVNSAQET